MIQVKYWYRAITKRTNYLEKSETTYFSYETHDGAVYALNPSAAADTIERRITHDRNPDQRNIVLDSVVIRISSENGAVVLRTAPRFSYESKEKPLTRIVSHPTPFKNRVETPAVSSNLADMRKYAASRSQNKQWANPDRFMSGDDDDDIPIHKYLTHTSKVTHYSILKMEHFDGKN